MSRLVRLVLFVVAALTFGVVVVGGAGAAVAAQSGPGGGAPVAAQSGPGG